MSGANVNGIPEAVRNLRLVWAFRGNYTPFMDCLDSTSDSPIYIIDDEVSKISRFATAEEAATNGGFTAYNTTDHPVHLLAIDNKLISNLPGGIADCALFNMSDFLIIEFKLNAQGKSDLSVNDTYLKAISQIEHTIDLFKDKITGVHVNFTNATEVRGFVVVSPVFPRARATEQNHIVDFALRTGLELSFEPVFTFT